MNVGAVDTVHVDESTGTTYQEVYTKDGADKTFATKGDVENNTNSIGTLQTSVGNNTTDIGKLKTDVASNTTEIGNLKTSVGNNTTDIGKLKTDVASNTTEIGNLKTSVGTNTTDIGNLKTDVASNTTKIGNLETSVGANTTDIGNLKTDVTSNTTEIGNLKTSVGTNTTDIGKLKTDVAKKADQTTVDALQTAVGNTYTRTEADDKFATKENLNTTKTELEGKITALETKTNTTDTKLTDVSARMTTAESDIGGLKADMAAAKSDITQLGDKDNDLQNQITNNNTNLQNQITQNKNDIKKNADDITTINGKLTTAESNIKQNTDDIGNLKTKVGTINNGTYLDGTKSVGDNLNKLNDGLAQEVADREAADIDLSDRIGTVDADGEYIKKSDTNNVSENLKALDAQAKTNAEATTKNTNDIQKNADAIAKEKAEREAKDTELSGEIANTNTALNKEIQDRKDADANLTTRIDSTDKRTAGIKRTDTGVEADNQTVIEGEVHFDQDGNVSGVKDLTTAGDAEIGGDLTVDGTIHADKITFGNDANNSTTIDKGTISSKNDKVQTDGTSKKSSLEFDESKFEVGVSDKDSNGHLIMDADKTQLTNRDLAGKNLSDIVADKDKIKTTVKDENGNVSSIKESASEINHYVEDKDKNWSTSHQDSTSSTTTISNKNGSQSTKTEQTTTDITNTATSGTITNDAKDIVNKASNEITNEAGTKITDKVGDNTRVTDTTGIKDSVGTDTFREMTSGKITDTAGDSTVITENTKGTTFGKEGSTGTTNIYGDTITTGTVDADKVNAKETTTGKLTAGVAEGTDGARLTVNDDGIKGSFKSGDYTSKSYILKNTLQNGVDNGKEPTEDGFIGSRTDHSITDDGKAKLDETVKDAAGSNVTNKTSTSTTTTIKDAAGNEKTSSSMDMDKISDKAGDSSVTTENGNGTTFTKTDSTAFSDGGVTDTNISGNKLTTGRVESNELNVSDKDGNNTADLNVKAGKGVTASAGNGTTTGSLDVKADEVGSSVKDGTGNGSDFRQRIDAIIGKVSDGTTETEINQGVKDITNTAKEGTIKNDAKDIVNDAKDTITNTAGTSITNHVGNSKATTDANGTTFENATTAVTDGGYTKTNINGNKLTTGALESNTLKVSGQKGDNEANLTVDPTNGINSFVTDGKTTNGSVDNATLSNKYIKKDDTHYNGSLDQLTKSTKIIQNGEDVIVEVKDAEKGEVSSEITKDGKSNKVTSTVSDGTKFTNTNANTAIGEGTITDTTIKGNTITTGKVTMDYADVMKDLGVRGNATVDKDMTVKGNTTLGETGKNTTLTVNSKATFNNGLEVTNGDTKLKNTTVDGKLEVTGTSHFEGDVTMDNNLSVGGDVTARSYKVGNNTYIDKDGLNANNQVVRNVADGSISEGSKDAVNGGQLYQVKNDLEGKVNKVGANAAAMANLHPMEFDPDSKWNIAAAMGNYGSETATAMGLFYRPNEDVMVNLSTSFGTGENMVGGGVSVRLGKGGNKVTRQENNELKAQVNDLTARMDALLSVLNPNMSKDFPDVPENHWAYEAVSRLAGNDIIQGYPDGEFHGDRTMTRYEMAEIIYNALSQGAAAEKELVEEFKPELQALAASNKATADAPVEG